MASRQESSAEAQLWELMAELDADLAAERGTMMGHDCLRVSGEFVAMIGRKTDRLILKLPRERVDELVAAGAGDEFAPAGKVFREWILLRDDDVGEWRRLLAEGVAFAAT